MLKALCCHLEVRLVQGTAHKMKGTLHYRITQFVKLQGYQPVQLRSRNHCGSVSPAVVGRKVTTGETELPTARQPPTRWFYRSLPETIALSLTAPPKTIFLILVLWHETCSPDSLVHSGWDIHAWCWKVCCVPRYSLKSMKEMGNRPIEGLVLVLWARENRTTTTAL